MKIHWYVCTTSDIPPYDFIYINETGSYYGYKNEPSHAVIDKYDLRKVSHGTLHELLNRSR